MFLPIECPGLCQHRPGHSLGKNLKLHEMKNEKNYGCVALPDTNSEKNFYTNSAKNFLLKIA